jgi:alkanesulfonate monooxygenase SsuD/methylene tetrahydromethanopterin reductase-like flavin-dependent oxidoreductase (luciferase family)
VWIAGRGARILQLAGEVGDGALIGALCSEPGLRYANTQIDLGLTRSGRIRSAVARAIWLHTGVASDEAVARDAVRPIVAGVLVSSGDAIRAIGIPVPEELLQRAARTPYGVHNPEMLAFARTLPTDVLDHFSVAGTPRQIGRRLAVLATMGIDHLAIVPWLAPGQSMTSFMRDLAAALPS